MLAPIRLTNAAAQLVLRTQVRRKETHPHSTQPHSRPYAALRWRIVNLYQSFGKRQRVALPGKSSAVEINANATWGCTAYNTP